MGRSAISNPMADAAVGRKGKSMLARTMTILLAATLVGGSLAGNAQARGGGGGHGGGFGGGGRAGGFSGGRFGGAHIGSNFRGTHIGNPFGRTRMSGDIGREFHRYHSGDYVGGWDCSLYDRQYPQQRPYTCY
jgi:hypothetical protein